MVGKNPNDIYRFSDEAKALIRGANFAHLATLMPDGSPKRILSGLISKESIL